MLKYLHSDVAILLNVYNHIDMQFIDNTEKNSEYAFVIL